MRALVLGEKGAVLERGRQRPRRGDGQARIRLRTAGVCSTDLELIKGYYGFRGVLGHEFVGEVEAADDKSWIGKRVVGTINLGCGTCAECVGHGAEHCRSRTVLGIFGHDGAFADELVLPEVNLLPVPSDLPDEHAVFTEPLAAALRIRDQVRCRPSDSVAVVGPGRLGSLIGQVLALDGTRVTMLGRRAEALQRCADWGLQTARVDEVESDSFDVVVEATGNEAGLARSLELVRPRGTLVLKSTFEGKATVDLTKLVVAEIRVVGSRCGPFAPALHLLEKGAVDVASMIHGTYDLDDAEAALEHAARPGVLKILLKA